MAEDPPILHVKKGAEIYIDRDPDGDGSSSPSGISQSWEGLGLMPPTPKRRPRAGARLSIFAVVILALAVVMMLRLLQRQTDKAVLAGYQAVLRGVEYQGSLMVSVSLTPVRQGGGAESATVSGSGPTRTASVLFSIAGTGEELSVSRPIPDEGLILGGGMRYTGKERTLQAELSVGRESVTLTLALPPRAEKP